MVSLCLDDKVTESSKEDIKEFFWSAQLCSYQLDMKHNEGPPCHCHLWETHQTVNHRTNREIAQWDTKERCYVSLQWFLNIEMGCIIWGFIYGVNVFERSSFICQYILYSWVERMEISCGVNVTFVFVIPLSSWMPAVPSFGIFLRRTEWARIKGPWKQRRQRAFSKASFLIHCIRGLADEGASLHRCLLNLILKNALSVAGACVRMCHLENVNLALVAFVCVGLWFQNVIKRSK